AMPSAGQEKPGEVLARLSCSLKDAAAAMPELQLRQFVQDVSFQLRDIAAFLSEQEAAPGSQQACPPPPTLACWTTLSGHRDPVSCLASVGTRLVSGSESGALKVWDGAGGKCLSSLEGHRDGVTGIAPLGPDSCATCSKDRTLKVWDLVGGLCSQTIDGLPRGSSCLASLICGQRVVTGSADRLLRIWSLADGSCTATLEGHRDTVLCATLVGQDILVSGSNDKTLRVWDASTNSCTKTLEGHKSAVCCVAVSSCGGSILSCPLVIPASGTCLSATAVSWLTPLARKAASRPLIASDVWDAPSAETAEVSTAAFLAAWKVEQDRSSPSVARAVLRAFLPRFASSGLALFAFMCVQLAQPFLIRELLGYLSPDSADDLKHGLLVAFSLVL
ncbi:unnamed protein product, partial [Polarella glacialis]